MERPGLLASYCVATDNGRSTPADVYVLELCGYGGRTMPTTAAPLRG